MQISDISRREIYRYLGYRGIEPSEEIARRVENAMDKLNGLPADNLEEILDADRRAREAVRGAR